MRYAVSALALVALPLRRRRAGDRVQASSSPRRPAATSTACAACSPTAHRSIRATATGAPPSRRPRSGDHVDVARALIDAGADVDLQDAERNNPLLVCGQTGNVAMLREVLRADPDLRRTNRFGGTALIPASDRGHVDMVRALLQTEIDVDHVNNLGWTALLEAVILGDGGPAHQQIVDMLVDADADVDLADRDGVTALEHARERGYDEIARTLQASR